MKKTNEKREIRLSGTGGQGLILCALILAEAANLESKFVVQTQSYGPEARGGASRAEVIISDKPIDFLMVEEADIFLALSQEAYLKYSSNVKKNGIIVVDEEIDPAHYRTKVNAFPMMRTARDKLGSEIVANIVALGVLTSLGRLLPAASLEEALRIRIPHHLELNIKAFQNGWELGMERIAQGGVETV